jgi:hypothetical protein
MSILLSSKPDKWKIKKIVSVLKDELDDTHQIRDKYDFDGDLGMKVSLTTKSHLLNNILEVFTIFKEQGYTDLTQEKKDYIMLKCKIIRRRINIHTAQLIKFNAINLNDNIRYFNLYLQIIYSYTLKGYYVANKLDFVKN